MTSAELPEINEAWLNRQANSSLRYAIGPILSEMLRQGWEEGIADFNVFITFQPAAFGVRMRDALRERLLAKHGGHPISIQLNDGFYDLRVAPDGITVRLSFDREWEEIEVLYRAMTMFYVPAEQFILSFEDEGGGRPDRTPRAPRTGSNDKIVDLASFRRDRQ